MASRPAIALRRQTRIAALLDAIAAMPRWSILLAGAIAARALTFGNPVVHVDEEFYFVTAQQMLHGALPFVDVWDRKPVGLFLLYLLPALFGVPGGIWAYQLLALASVVATAMLIVAMADRAGWRRGALAGGLLYIFMLDFAGGQGGQSPVFYNLPMAAAAWLVLRYTGGAETAGRRAYRPVLAMALVGIAMQIKYAAVFEGMFFGLWLLWNERSRGTAPARLVGWAAALALVAALPTALAWAFYTAIGHGPAWLFANLTSILAREEDPPRIWWRNVREVACILAPPLALAALSAPAAMADGEYRQPRRFLFGWLIASVTGLILFGGFFNHYTLPVMVPACLCCAGFFGNGKVGRRLAVPLLAVALAGGIFATYASRHVRGDARELEALADAIGDGPGCLYLYSGPPILYAYSTRCVTTAWLFPRHLSRIREAHAVGVDQMTEIGRIFARRPQVVAMSEPYDGERADVRSRTLGWLKAEGYRLKGVWPVGTDDVAVFEAQAVPRAAAAVPAPRPARAASKPS